MDLLASATEKGLVRSCHDCSEGGLAVAAAEMSFAGGYGMELDLSQVPVEEGVDRDDVILLRSLIHDSLLKCSQRNIKNLRRQLVVFHMVV